MALVSPMTDQPRITPDQLLRAYAMGIFPMASSATDPMIHWVDPRRRGIFDLEQFHISRSLRRALLHGDYSVTVDTDFAGVVALIGGVYGVVLGSAFFGESMFSRRTNGSKIALAWLVHRLRTGGFTLFDTQFLTPHLASLGALEIPRAEYQRRLQRALDRQAHFAPPDYAPYPSLISSSGASGSSTGSTTSGATKPESHDSTQTS